MLLANIPWYSKVLQQYYGTCKNKKQQQKTLVLQGLHIAKKHISSTMVLLVTVIYLFLFFSDFHKHVTSLPPAVHSVIYI